MEIFLSICLGLGLSAACGFRVFVPLLCLSVAAHLKVVPLTGSFAWVGSDAALYAFSAATLLEVGAYYIPWLDNALDTIAGPAAVLAGIFVTASVITDIDPFWRWTLAVIAGGGLAATTQLATTKTRLASSVTTGGLANPALATVEAVSSTALSVIAVVWPIVALVLVLVILVVSLMVIWFVGKRVVGWFRRKPETPDLKPVA